MNKKQCIGLGMLGVVFLSIIVCSFLADWRIALCIWGVAALVISGIVLLIY
jgi:hypothetical protein